MLVSQTTRHEMVLEYLTQRQKYEEEEAPVGHNTKRQNLKPKLEQKVRQNIGHPLTQSKAQQNWNREVDQCPHEAEYLRHRAGRGHFWFTCLQCGGRWERTEIPSSSTTSASTSTVIQVKGSGSFPKYLPPPRSRPELPTHMVEVSGMERQKSKQMPIHPSKLRGRSADQMVGLRPESRAKTPTRKGSHGIVESFVLRTETPPSEQEMMTEEEWHAAMMCDPRMDIDPEDPMAPCTLGRRSELLSSQLVHSSQLSTWDEALARKVRSISHFAMMILLCTFACESRHMAPQNFDAINPEFDCPVGFPLWMSRPSHCLLRTENYLETPLADHTKVSQDTTKTTWKAAWLIPMTSSNQWLFQEDTSWNREPRAIPKSVKAFITQAVRDHFGTDIMEIYSPPRVTKEAQRQNDQRKHPPFRVGQAMDLTTGFDFRRPQDRLLALRRVRRFRPALLILCPPCTTFSLLRNLSNHKRDPRVVRDEEIEGLLHWEFTLMLVEEQISHNRAFPLEHPASATSWDHPTVKQLEQRPGVYQIVVDMCCFSLRTKEGLAAKKPTRLLTNCYPLVKLLRRRCQNHHPHQPLLGGRAAEAAKYTRPFVQAILRGLRHFLNIYGVTYTSWGEIPMPPPLPAPLMDVANDTTTSISQVLANYIHGESSFLEEYDTYVTYAFPSSKILGERLVMMLKIL